MSSNYPFVAKLYAMLSDTENSAFISWSPEGSAFFVWNPTEFSATVLPKYFKHNNFCSFVRQLNIYGFHKVENDNWMFTHDDKLFQRDQPEMIAKIQRRRQQKRSSSAMNDDGEDVFVTQQSAPKKMKSEETPSTTVVSTAMSTPIPATPATPASTFLPNLLSHSSSISSTSTVAANVTVNSSLEDDVALLKNMNNVLLSELTQMKRKTQAQEETISWLISELARTQRHVELMSQQQQRSNMKTDLTLSNSSSPFLQPSPVTPQQHALPFASTPQTPNNPFTSAPLVRTPVQASHTLQQHSSMMQSHQIQQTQTQQQNIQFTAGISLNNSQMQVPDYGDYSSQAMDTAIDGDYSLFPQEDTVLM